MNLKMIKTTVIALILCINVFGQSDPTTFNNPILPGFHPDPSITRVGDDYYMVNSTFVWFPGLPIYHSKDLVNWKLIGHALDRPDMVDFTGLADMLGLFAPTIRHHDGLFYIINTCVYCKGNFYITAKDPAGPWSDPTWLPEAPGIDPSLFWDDDGKCYYTGNTDSAKKEWPDQKSIYIQELDLAQNKLVGEPKHLTFGHANNASHTEAPHLYKIKGKYMLMVAEGGTGDEHAMTVHHSDSIYGPYLADYTNPVITHRHLGKDYPIQATGHADLVETQNGEWWAVMLGKRPIDGLVTLGRETFLAKVEFEGQTPIFNPGEGKVLMTQTRPDLPWTPVEKEPATDQFDGDKLGMKWATMRTPKEPYYKLDKGKLSLKLRKETVDGNIEKRILDHPSILVQRIENHKFAALTRMEFKTAKDNEQAGLSIYRIFQNHINLMKDKNSLVLIQTHNGKRTEIARIPYKKKEVFLHVEGNDLEVQFSFGETKESLKPIGPKLNLIVIADGQGYVQFNGPGVGMYATSNGEDSKNEAQFDWFYYKGK